MQNLLMLWKYLHHLVREAQASTKYIDEFSILLPQHSSIHMERRYDMESQMIYPGSPVCIPHWTQWTLPARI